MNNKILFMILGREIKYLQNSEMDHREWYESLGLDPNNYDNIVRGFIVDGKIIFFKGMFNYDEEVIRVAKEFAPLMISNLNNPNLEVYCGILANSLGGKWEPILKINPNEFGVAPPKAEKKEYIPKELESSIEFKNNYEDSKFIKLAVIVTIIVLILTIIIKVVLMSKMKFSLGGSELLLLLGQVALLGVTIYGYVSKKSFTKYTGVAAGLLLVLTFNIFDIILGILYFLFSIDASMFTKLISKIKKK